MAAHPGSAFHLEMPDFTQRSTAALDTWSSSITTASRPVVSDVVNSSSNLGLVASGGIVPTVTTSATPAANPTDHATNRSVGYANNHLGPSDIGSAGYDWFERIFLDPTSSSIKVLNSTDLSIRTLSTYRHQSPGLASITLDTGAGTSMSVEPAYTYNHPPSTYLQVVFTAVKAGPASYKGTVTFDYATGGEVFDVTIVRVLPAPWRPLDKFIESLEWKTSVLAARAFETRAALRELPRIDYTYEFILLERELDEFRSVAENPEVPTITPLWYDEYYIGSVTADASNIPVDTTNSEFVAGGYALVAEEGGESEFLEVLSVAADSITFSDGVVNNYTKATVVSALLTLVRAASYKLYNNNVYKGKLQLTGYDAMQRSIVAPVEHDSIAVLTNSSVIKRTLNASLGTKGKYVDNGTGIVRFKAIENRVRNSFDHLWMVSGYTARKEMKDWLYSRVGRQKKFLFPTFQNDLFLASEYLGGTSMEVFENSMKPPFYFQAILLTGAVYYGTCSSKTSDGGVDSLVIDALGVSFIDAELDLLSIMFINRYGSDKFTITYTNHQIAELKTMTTGI